MKIRDLMTRNVTTCRTDTNVAIAGSLMWEHDCGIVPVVDDAEKVIGILTDRDICIALCTRNVRASELTAGDVASKRILSCTAEEDVRFALETMRQARIHRLPVVNRAGALEGIVSLDDIVMYAEKLDGKAKTEVPYDDVLHTLQAVSAHHQSQPLVTLAG
ncbi:MAG: CBS domain-containing protein [Acidobacteriia bacterium]|nr:CBS domain-containing protein [Terriglobia bacterium]